IYQPAAFTTEGLALIHAHIAPEQRITIGTDDAARFAANVVCFGHTILLSSCSETLRARLYRGEDVANSFPAQRRLSLLPDAAAGPPIVCGHSDGAYFESGA